MANTWAHAGSGRHSWVHQAGAGHMAIREDHHPEEAADARMLSCRSAPHSRSGPWLTRVGIVLLNVSQTILHRVDLLHHPVSRLQQGLQDLWPRGASFRTPAQSRLTLVLRFTAACRPKLASPALCRGPHAATTSKPHVPTSKLHVQLDRVKICKA